MNEFYDYYADYKQYEEDAKLAAEQVENHHVNDFVIKELDTMIQIMTTMYNSSAFVGDSNIQKAHNDLNKIKSYLEKIKEFLSTDYLNVEDIYIKLNEALIELKKASDQLEEVYDDEPNKSSATYIVKRWNIEKRQYEGYFNKSAYDKDVKNWEDEVTELKNTCETIINVIDECILYLDSIDGYDAKDGKTNIKVPNTSFPKVKAREKKYRDNLSEKSSFNLQPYTYYDDEKGKVDVTFDDPKHPEWRYERYRVNYNGVDCDAVAIYNPNDILLELDYTDFSGKLIHKYEEGLFDQSNYDYEYDGDNLVHTVRLDNSGSKKEWFYKYDDKGRILKEEEYYNGKLIHKYEDSLFDQFNYEYEYDGDNLVHMARVDSSGDKKEWNYKYDDKGRILEEEEYYNGEINLTTKFDYSNDKTYSKTTSSEYSKHKLVYDSNTGTLLHEEEFDANMRQEKIFDYDPDTGNKMHAKYVMNRDIGLEDDEESTYVVDAEWSYNENGNVSQVKVSSDLPSDFKSRKTDYTTTYEYDAEGNKIAEHVEYYNGKKQTIRYDQEDNSDYYD